MPLRLCLHLLTVPNLLHPTSKTCAELLVLLHVKDVPGSVDLVLGVSSCYLLTCYCLQLSTYLDIILNSLLVMLQDPPVLTGWTTDTLDDGCFTFSSVVYQIDVMMDKLLRNMSQDVPSDAVGLLQMLRNRSFSP